MIIDATFTESHSKIDANFGILSKGEKGDAFTYEDFTEEQLEDLRCTDRWENHEKRITNLEKKISADFFVTDEDTAYKKTVPSNACPFAQINSIGGMSYKSKNLISILPWANQTINGVTITLDKDGVYHLSGTATATSACLLPLDAKLPIGKYTLSLNCNKVIGTAFENAVYLVARSADGDWKIQSSTHLSRAYITVTTTVDIVDFMFAFMEGVNCDGLTIAPMCNKGDYIPYEPYYEGLRDSKVTEIKSHCASLIPYPYKETTKTINGVTFTDNGDGTVTANGTATDNAHFTLVRKVMPIGTYYLSGSPNTNEGAIIYVSNDDWTIFKMDNGNGLCFDVTTEEHYMFVINVDKGVTVNNLVFKPKLVEGSSYREPISYPIPNEIQALEGYGYGINDACYNSVDIERKKLVKRVGCADMGDISYNIADNGLFVYTTFAEIGKRRNSTVFVSTLEECSYAQLYENGNDAMLMTDDGTIYVRSGAFKTMSSSAEVQAYLKGTMLYYELDTITETDISEHLADFDNLIEVEGGGVIEFVNEYEKAVPTSITYLLKESAS